MKDGCLSCDVLVDPSSLRGMFGAGLKFFASILEPKSSSTQSITPLINCADRKFFAIHIPTAPSPTTTLIPVNKALLQSAFIKSLTFVFYPFIRSSPLPPGSILRVSLSSKFRRSRGTCFHITPLSQKQQFRGSPCGFLLLLVFVVCCII